MISKMWWFIVSWITEFEIHSDNLILRRIYEHSLNRWFVSHMQSEISNFSFSLVWSRFFWSTRSSFEFDFQFEIDFSYETNILWSFTSSEISVRIVRRWFRNFFNKFLIDEEFFSCCRISWFKIVFLSITNVTFIVRSEFKKSYTQRSFCTFERFNLVVFAYTLSHSNNHWFSWSRFEINYKFLYLRIIFNFRIRFVKAKYFLKTSNFWKIVIWSLK
jgi:hypothetical protein